uniref:L-Fucosyltransferase n=1 Tax=Hirondellea gigas TaxID=1518452 RepID=A0A2P2I3V3_9CRUS
MWTHVPSANCSSPAYSFEPSGKIGNQLSEYVHLLCLHQQFSINVGLHPKMWNKLRIVFPHLSLPIMTEGCIRHLSQRKKTLAEIRTELSRGLSASSLLGGTPCDPFRFWNCRQHWRKDLTFSEPFQVASVMRTAHLIQQWQWLHPVALRNREITLVTAHVRRSDFTYTLNRRNYGQLMPPVYYQNAFHYFRERYANPLFMVITEPAERQWCRDNLAKYTNDVLVVDDNNEEAEDLALIASFKHIIYSHGTFGFWGILLSHARTVVYPEKSGNPAENRYSMHQFFDHIRHNATLNHGVNFVTVRQT